MSNEEKKRLEEYRKRRARWILVQVCILLCLSLVFVGLLFTYQNIEKTYYVTYKENSSIDYKVKLKDNNIYQEEYLGEEYSYVSSVVDTVLATFNYNLEIDAENVSYDFIMKADAMVQIVDSSTNNAIYKKNYNLLPETKEKIKTNKLALPLPLEINYDRYNDEVKNVVKTLDLKSYRASLLVNVTYNVKSGCEDFDSNNNTHVLTLTIPLDISVFKITESQSIPTDEKTIACETNLQKDTLKYTAIIVLGADVICLIILIVFIYLTRNTHITYSNKVKKIVNAYKSFIHKINNKFDTTGYQVLYVNTIREMLEIRDTIQSPILMSENEDKTMTEFIIPTSNNILYIHEIKIENYDEIYGLNNVIKEEVLEETIKTTNEMPTEEVLSDSKVENSEETDLETIEEIKETVLEEAIEDSNTTVIEKNKETSVQQPVSKGTIEKKSEYKPKIIIDNQGGYLLNLSIKTPDGDTIYKTSEKKKEINLNDKNK